LLTERSIINFLIWTGGLILGPYLAISALEFNFYPVGAFLAACSLVIIFGVLRDKMCILPVIGLFVAGKFLFIPVLRPAPTELFPFAVIVYYLITYVALQRKKVQTGPLIFFIPIMVIGLILVYHEHSFGLRSMGAGREGGRGAIFVLIAVVTYVCGVSINSPSPRFLRWVPIICMLATAISTIPYAVTTYFPQTASYFFIFTDAINSTAYSASVLDSADIVRNQGQANVGSVLMACLLAYYPLFSWWRPTRWWVAVLGLACIALVVLGGFRSALATFGLMILTGAIAYYPRRALLLLFPVLAVGIIGATALQNSGAIRLPQSAQRSLAFLPGNWDSEVQESAIASNDFRDRIKRVYIQDDFRTSPWFGNGLSYDSIDFARYNNLALTHDTPDFYYQTKAFTTGKVFHIGWISLYDAVGFVGFAAYLALSLSLINRTGWMVFRKDRDTHSPLFPLKVWMLCNLVPGFVGFFTVFGDFKAAFPSYCFYAILWTHLDRIEKLGYHAPVPMRSVPFDPSRTEAPVPA
jgi:hypothetical protein